MALINCPECNREISDKAGACPNCGLPLGEVKSVENSLDPNIKSCPSCKNGNTQTIKMMCLSGTSTGTSTGGGVSTDFEVGIGGMNSESQTSLAEKYTPGLNPEDSAKTGIGCFIIIFAFGSFAMSFSAETGEGILFFIILGFAIWVVGVYMMQRLKKNGLPDQKKEWDTKVKLYEKGWICHKCGNTWLP